MCKKGVSDKRKIIILCSWYIQENYIYVENVLSKNNIIETGSNDLMDHIDNSKSI